MQASEVSHTQSKSDTCVHSIHGNTLASRESHVPSTTPAFTLSHMESNSDTCVHRTLGETVECSGAGGTSGPEDASEDRRGEGGRAPLGLEDLAREVLQTTAQYSDIAGFSGAQDGGGRDNPWEHRPGEVRAPLGLEDLPRDVLHTIAGYLPTVSLLVCATAHQTFTELLKDTQFLNRHTRRVLGFKAGEEDITYQSVPPPVAPLQDLWFQTYLQRAAPHSAGLVTTGVVFYDLLCFKHLLDTWVLQGLNCKYWMLLSEELKSKHRTPLLLMVSGPMLTMLTKLALCHPQILLQTVDNFITFTIYGWPLDCLGSAWHEGVPGEYKAPPCPHSICEVVTRRRIGSALSSFFLTVGAQSCVGWSGLIDYSTFTWRNTWGVCKIPVNASLSVIRQQSHDVFKNFSQNMGQNYISIRNSKDSMFRGMCRQIQQQRELILTQLQATLEKSALKIHRKISRTLPPNKCREVKNFLDSVAFMGKEELVRYPRKQREWSRTAEVAVQRYLHRYLNLTLGGQVLALYQDPVCHRALCFKCHNSRTIAFPPPPACLEKVGCQHIPLKIWPPHLLQHALTAMPALARLVCLDVELWKRALLDQPLPHKVALFIRWVLDSVYLPFCLDPSRPGVIARRITLQES